MGRAFCFGREGSRAVRACGEVGMLRLRNEYRFAMLIPALSMTTTARPTGRAFCLGGSRLFRQMGD